MAIKLKLAPATEPVTLSDAKTFLRVSGSTEDAVISPLITAVRQTCEAWTGRALVTQTWTLWLDAFPKGPRGHAPDQGYFQLPVSHFDATRNAIELPRPPLQSVTHLKTYDPKDQATVFAASNYLVDNASEPGRIVLNASSFWPANLRSAQAVEIEFVTGYGDATAVPEALKQGMLVWIQQLYSNKNWLFEPGAAVPGLLALNEIPSPVIALWAPYKIFHGNGLI